MGRQIVICLDGTGNKVSSKLNTNIVHIYSCLLKNNNQLSFYHPGVGTFVPDWSNSLSKKYYKIANSVFGNSVDDQVIDAYNFLMENYEQGDKIFVFGFSRGAYSARKLAGLLFNFGLLDKGNLTHFKQLLMNYNNTNFDFPLARKIKYNFSRIIEIQFLGLFDTVIAKFGLITPYFSFPNSKYLSIANEVRHAVSIDEKRKQFYYDSIDLRHPNSKEVFFSGVHSNIGGGYKNEGLSKIVLEWMLGEATHAGLILKKSKVDKIIYGLGSKYQAPNFKDSIEDSLWKTFYFLLLIIPSRNIEIVKVPDEIYNNLQIRWDWRISGIREIPDNACIHSSVIEKINFKEKKNIYKPNNLTRFMSKNKYTIIENLDIRYKV